MSTFGNGADTKEHALALEQLADLKSKNAANAKDWNGGIGEEQIIGYGTEESGELVL